MNLEQQLTDTIVSHLELVSRLEQSGRPTRGDQSEPISQRAKAIARELVAQAVSAGLPLTRFTVEQERMGGGNTAGLVATATLHAPFVFKLDNDSKKLAEEGLLMTRLKADLTLPEAFRQSLPRVYAVRTESPYAYLMEIFPSSEGFKSLEDRLYASATAAPPSLSEVLRLVNAVLDLLFLGYGSTVDRRRQPNLFADYIERIQDRLAATAQVDDRFASRPVKINGGRPLTPWAESLRAINLQGAKVQALTPRFMTNVHGDPNPGNMILVERDNGLEVKQIDPKEWGTGDYLFDITKLTHFLEGTGPAEKTAYGQPKVARFVAEGKQTVLDYALAPPSWTHEAVQAIRERTAVFARGQGDLTWELRYRLGMASNLLGLPLGRLKTKPEAAAILYGEGLRWLEEFRDGLEQL